MLVKVKFSVRIPNSLSWGSSQKKLFYFINTQQSMALTSFHFIWKYLDYIAKYGRLNERTARQKFWQIVSAVEFCHNKGIVHRDLKVTKKPPTRESKSMSNSDNMKPFSVFTGWKSPARLQSQHQNSGFRFQQFLPSRWAARDVVRIAALRSARSLRGQEVHGTWNRYLGEYDQTPTRLFEKINNMSNLSFWPIVCFNLMH